MWARGVEHRARARRARRRLRAVRAGVRARADALLGLPRRSASDALRARLGGRDRLRPERGRGLRRPARARRAGASTGSRAAPASCRWSTPSSGSSTSRPSTPRTSTRCRRTAATRCGQARRCSTRASTPAPASASTTSCTGAASAASSRTSRYAARCELRGVEGRHRLHLHQLDQDVAFTHDTDVVILATGYEPAPLPVPAGLLALDAAGRPVVELDYRLRLADGTPVDPVRAERRAAHPRRRHAGPRPRRAPQRGDRQRAVRPRGLRRARAQRLPVLRRAAAASAARERAERRVRDRPPIARRRGRPRAPDRAAVWARANRELIAKLLTELEFEELLHPDERRRVVALAGRADAALQRPAARARARAGRPGLAAGHPRRRRGPAARCRRGGRDRGAGARRRPGDDRGADRRDRLDAAQRRPSARDRPAGARS